MSFARRLRLDFHPALFAVLSLWGMLEFCEVASSGYYPRSVEAAYQAGITVALFWWIWSDAVRRGFPLLPVWGVWMTVAASTVVVVYLFASRGWWALVTILLYGIVMFFTTWAINEFVAMPL